MRADIARARLMIDQCRLLSMQAAREIDKGGVKAARHNIALIKVAAPQMASWVVDRALQVCVSRDQGLAVGGWRLAV